MPTPITFDPVIDSTGQTGTYYSGTPHTNPLYASGGNDDPYDVAVGPIHAGVIESGHFRFRVVGDRILHVDVRLFYKHRGLERAA